MVKQSDGGGYYISLCRAYWQRAMEEVPEPTDTHLYFYLVEYCNRLYWKNPFRLSNGALCSALNITTKTLTAARSRLVEKGLIRFVPAGNSKRESTQYDLLLGGKNSTTLGTTSDTTLGTTSDTPHIYKRQKTKNNTSISELSIFGVEEVSVSPGTKPRKEFLPPSVEDVIAYAQKNGETEDEARRFFDLYNSQGWKKAGGVQIVNWESAFNYWISNKDRYKVPAGKPSAADNIRESQEYIIREMRQSVLNQGENCCSEEVPEELPPKMSDYEYM